MTHSSVVFQPTRPRMGATPMQRGILDAIKVSTHAPANGRDAPCKPPELRMIQFQPTRPRMGATD